MFYDVEIAKDQTALWFLGQAGYYIKSCGKSILIDPYLSDSAGKSNPLFKRLYPSPVQAGEMKADIFIITHDHLDHLDPETIGPYPHKDSTRFVAPRHASKKLESLGIAKESIVTVDHGDTANIDGVAVTGVFALGTSPDVLDTTGYLIRFPNGKTLYHSADTAYCQLLLDACPHADVLLVCINGKYGNLAITEAVALTKAVNPLFVIPNHYDIMALNSENPEAFRYFCSDAGIGDKCRILGVPERFTW